MREIPLEYVQPHHETYRSPEEVLRKSMKQAPSKRKRQTLFVSQNTNKNKCRPFTKMETNNFQYILDFKKEICKNRIFLCELSGP